MNPLVSKGHRTSVRRGVGKIKADVSRTQEVGETQGRIEQWDIFLRARVYRSSKKTLRWTDENPCDLEKQGMRPPGKTNLGQAGR